MNEYNVIITQKAFSDIYECVLFVSNVSKETVKDLYKEIMDSINSLKSFPNVYSNIDGLTVGTANIKRMPIHRGRYFILYKVEENVVTIYDIIDSRKDNSILKL